MVFWPHVRDAAWILIAQAALWAACGCGSEQRPADRAPGLNAESIQTAASRSAAGDAQATPSAASGSESADVAAVPAASAAASDRIETATRSGAPSRERVREIVARGPKFQLPQLPPTGERKAVPKLEFVDMSGKTVKLEDLKGHVVLVVFWATWCRPCAMEIPHLVHMTDAYTDAGFKVIAPSVDRQGLAAVKHFLERNRQINYTIIPNGVPASMAFGGVRGVPTSFLIDREGRVIRSYAGLQPPEILEASVQAALLE